MPTLKPMRRLPLQGAHNTRDLGGYPCQGGVTRWKQFLRSATLAYLTDTDIEMLLEYGLTTVIDLRSVDECAQAPSLLIGRKDICTSIVPLMDELDPSKFEGDVPGSMSGLYISVLDNKMPEMKEIFTLLANAPGTALFHCSAGKDRTGIVAMLLLHLAGVQAEDIVADYAITEIYMQGVISRVMDGMEMHQHVLLSRPKSMRRVLQHLQETYGSAEEYLRTIGLNAALLEALRAKLVDPI